MTEVDFYILSEDDPQQRNLFACRLTEQVFRKGHQVYLHTGDEASGKSLDELLWGFRPQSFVPHGLLGSGDDEKVAIGWHDNPGVHCDVLINLTLEVPSFIGRFQRVAEVVVQSPHIRDPLRNSYKFYRDRGYPLRKRKL
jgi:DNA polymerase-3 subunit chi